MADFAATDQDETQINNAGDQTPQEGRTVAFNTVPEGIGGGGVVVRLDPLLVRSDP